VADFEHSFYNGEYFLGFTIYPHYQITLFECRDKRHVPAQYGHLPFYPGRGQGLGLAVEVHFVNFCYYYVHSFYSALTVSMPPFM